ncbi:MAG: AtpZ/AtpI family protein [Planctomycetales bacterium]|nr:AtpZ/AtpI family protein [Planctomycetales bacterium]
MLRAAHPLDTDDSGTKKRETRQTVGDRRMRLGDEQRRADMRAALRRDRKRLARREVGHRSFWRSLGVLGMVGWPIAGGAGGGAWLGRLLDERFDTGVRYTLILLTLGCLCGCLAAWKAVIQRHGE